MKTLISSIPLISIPNAKEYSIDNISEILKSPFYSKRMNENTLKVILPNGKKFLIKMSKSIVFYKISPLIFKILFILNLTAFFYNIYLLAFTGILGLNFVKLGILDVILVLALSFISFIIQLFPEIIYYSVMANKHTKNIDEILLKLEMHR